MFREFTCNICGQKYLEMGSGCPYCRNKRREVKALIRFYEERKKCWINAAHFTLSRRGTISRAVEEESRGH